MSTPAVIREYTPQDREGVLALFQRHFGSWSSERWARRWQWQYHDPRGCSDCRSFIQVAESDGAIVGHLGAFPLPLRINADRFDALCAEGFVVERDHRWAAFSLLKNLASKGGIVFGTSWSRAASKLFQFYGAMALPLSEVRYVYQLRHRGATCRELRRRLPPLLHWMANRWSSAMVTPLLDRRWGRRSKPLPRLDQAGDLRPISRFGEEYDELWRSAAGQFEVSLDKNAAYMNWRYLDCPTMSPIRLGCYDGHDRLAGAIVACRRAHRDVRRRPCGEDGEIVELIVREPESPIVERLVVPVMERLDRHGVDAVAATGLHPRLHPLLEGIGFERTACGWGTLRAISNIRDRSAGDILQDELWYFTSGDGDHLFGQGI